MSTLDIAGRFETNQFLSICDLREPDPNEVFDHGQGSLIFASSLFSLLGIDEADPIYIDYVQPPLIFINSHRFAPRGFITSRRKSIISFSTYLFTSDWESL